MLTCSRHEKAATRYFFTFFVHAEDTTLKMALGVEGSSVEIVLWQDLVIAPIAYKRASLPCHIQLYSERCNTQDKTYCHMILNPVKPYMCNEDIIIKI